MDRHASLPALIALAALAVIWGYNWVVMKEALQYAGPFAFAGLRCFLGGFILFIVILFKRRSFLPASFGGALILGLLQTTGFIGLATWALVSGGVGKTAVLAYTMPFWLLVLSWPLLGERLRGFEWLAVGLACLGLILVIEPWRMHSSLFSIGLALLAGFSWALSGIWTKRLQSRGQIERLPLTAWQLVLGSLPMIAAALYEAHPPDWTPYFIWAVIYNTLPGTAVSYLLFLYAIEKLPAGIAGMGTLATPIIGVLAAWLQLGDAPGFYEAIGIVLIILGLAVLTWKQLRRETTDECVVGGVSLQPRIDHRLCAERKGLNRSGAATAWRASENTCDDRKKCVR
jgi:drug/metabolite transporter (DMT)-like permease